MSFRGRRVHGTDGRLVSGVALPSLRAYLIFAKSVPARMRFAAGISAEGGVCASPAAQRTLAPAARVGHPVQVSLSGGVSRHRRQMRARVFARVVCRRGWRLSLARREPGRLAVWLERAL